LFVLTLTRRGINTKKGPGPQKPGKRAIEKRTQSRLIFDSGGRRAYRGKGGKRG